MKTIASLPEMLRYFECKTLREFGEKHGFYTQVDAMRALETMYDHAHAQPSEDDAYWAEMLQNAIAAYDQKHA